MAKIIERRFKVVTVSNAILAQMLRGDSRLWCLTSNAPSDLEVIDTRYAPGITKMLCFSASWDVIPEHIEPPEFVVMFTKWDMDDMLAFAESY